MGLALYMNQLKSLPIDIFKKQTSLQILYLGYNQLRDLPTIPAGIDMISEIEASLSFNCIGTRDAREETIAYLDQLFGSRIWESEEMFFQGLCIKDIDYTPPKAPAITVDANLRFYGPQRIENLLTTEPEFSGQVLFDHTFTENGEQLLGLLTPEMMDEL